MKQGPWLLLATVSLFACWSGFARAEATDGPSQKSETAGNEPETWRSEMHCGVNCLYVLLRSLGTNVTYDRLCEQTALGPDGTSMAELARVSGSYGVPLVAVRSGPDGIDQWPLPAIVHQQRVMSSTGHFILLVGYNGDVFSVLDSTTGQLKAISRGDFLEKWSGFALLRNDPAPLGWEFWIAAGWLACGTILLGLGSWRWLARHRWGAGATVSQSGLSPG